MLFSNSLDLKFPIFQMSFVTVLFLGGGKDVRGLGYG